MSAGNPHHRRNSLLRIRVEVNSGSKPFRVFGQQEKADAEEDGACELISTERPTKQGKTDMSELPAKSIRPVLGPRQQKDVAWATRYGPELLSV